GAGPRRLLPRRPREVRAARRAPPAVQNPARPRLPRRPGEAILRGRYLRDVRGEDAGDPLLRLAIQRSEGGGRDPPHGTGPLRADPRAVGALRFTHPQAVRRAVLLLRDAGSGRRAAAWRAIPVSARFPGDAQATGVSRQRGDDAGASRGAGGDAPVPGT